MCTIDARGEASSVKAVSPRSVRRVGRNHRGEMTQFHFSPCHSGSGFFAFCARAFRISSAPRSGNSDQKAHKGRRHAPSTPRLRHLRGRCAARDGGLAAQHAAARGPNQPLPAARHGAAHGLPLGHVRRALCQHGARLFGRGLDQPLDGAHGALGRARAGRLLRAVRGLHGGARARAVLPQPARQRQRALPAAGQFVGQRQLPRAPRGAGLRRQARLAVARLHVERGRDRAAARGKRLHPGAHVDQRLRDQRPRPPGRFLSHQYNAARLHARAPAVVAGRVAPRPDQPQGARVPGLSVLLPGRLWRHRLRPQPGLQQCDRAPAHL